MWSTSCKEIEKQAIEQTKEYEKKTYTRIINQRPELIVFFNIRFLYEDVSNPIFSGTVNLYMLVPLVILAVACFVFGTFATPLINFFGSIAATIM